MKNKTVH
jgi:hypothetical protein